MEENRGNPGKRIGLKINTGVFLNKKYHRGDWRGLYDLGCVGLAMCKVNVVQFYSARKTV